MATFVDNFDRADGAPGHGWSATVDSIAISGYALTGAGQFQAVNTSCSGDSIRTATVHVTSAYQAGYYRAGPSVCCAPGQSGCFTFAIRGATSSMQYTISNGGIAGSPISQVSYAGPIPGVYKLTLTWESGVLTGYMNDVQVIQTTHGANAAQVYSGCAGYSTTAPILDFSTEGIVAVGLGVTPSPIGNYGATVPISFLGTGTSWTPGTPGSPTFTVDHGTLSNQVVADSTHASATYDPGTFLGTATFSDPSTGATCSVLVTSNPGTVTPPTGADTWSPWKDLVDSTGGTNDPDFLLTNKTPFITANLDYPTIDLPLITGLQEMYAVTVLQQAVKPGTKYDLGLIWSIINGQLDPSIGTWQYASGRPISDQLGEILARWDTLLTSNHWTLGDVITQITGLGVPTIHDVLDQLGNLDLSAITDKLDSIQGAGGVSLATIAAALSSLRGTGQPSIADVITAIGNISPGGSTDLTPVLDKLSLIQPSSSFDLSTITTKIISSSVMEDLLGDAELAITGEAGITLAVLKTLLEAIAAAQAAGSSLHSPLLDESLTLTELDTIPFTAPFVYTGECHGVRFEFTDFHEGVAGYAVGDYTAIQHAGTVGFTDPDGFPEPYQWLTWNKGLVVPKCMTKAAGFIWSSNRKIAGSVTPFTLEAAE